MTSRGVTFRVNKTYDHEQYIDETRKYVYISALISLHCLFPVETHFDHFITEPTLTLIGHPTHRISQTLALIFRLRRKLISIIKALSFGTDENKQSLSSYLTTFSKVPRMKKAIPLRAQ